MKILLACTIAVSASAAELTDATSALFSGSANCAFCHDQWRDGLTDRKGRDVSIAGDWRATMMAHAFKDPLWRAVIEAEVEKRPKLQGFIEDKCQTCHAPMARTQARHDGASGLSLAAAKSMPLAGDGVSCTLCHQIQPSNLGQSSSFTGHYEISEARQIFGPYPDPFAGPMRNHVDYTPVHGRHTQESSLCATCHTLFTPILDADGTVVGQFPEQTPFLEWRNSVHPRRGRHCQDCHMPRLNEPIQVSSRPPWLGRRKPFWRHQFVGGNAFMLNWFKDQPGSTEPNAEAAQFEGMIAMVRQQLARAASVSVRGRRELNDLVLQVEVRNLTGHKFPTGHPYRRAWLHVRINDAAGRLVFESGGYDERGRLRASDGQVAPHLDVITQPEQVQVYESVMGDAAGAPTHSLLSAATYLKDNRLPPEGFRADGPETAHTAVCGGAERDANFNAQGSGSDEVTYRVPVGQGQGRWSAEVTLLYQSVPPETVAGLLQSRSPAAQEFSTRYLQADHQPEIVRSVRLKI
jgi:hypothetical protein